MQMTLYHLRKQKKGNRSLEINPAANSATARFKYSANLVLESVDTASRSILVYCGKFA